MDDSADAPAAEVLDYCRPPPSAPTRSVYGITSVVWFVIGCLLCASGLSLFVIGVCANLPSGPLFAAAFIFLGALFVIGSFLIGRVGRRKRP